MSLRVAHVSATFPPYLGGAGTTCFHHAEGLARRGHHVEVFTADAPGEPPPSAATVHRLRPRLAIGNAPLLPPLARLDGFEVVHFHHPFIFGAELLGLSRLRGLRAPLVVSHHNRLIGDGARRALFFAYEETSGRMLARSADRICVVSDEHADSVDYLRGQRRRHPSKVLALPNGVDLETFSPGDGRLLRERRGIPADAFVAVVVSALDRAHWLKRPDLAIEAVARSGHEGLHLLVVGGGEWLERCRAQARDAGIGVTFLGALGHDGLPEALRAADALLVPSDREAFGTVFLEGMACGLPVVATDSVGARVLVRHGENGLLAPRGDASALGVRLRELAGVPGDRRRAMGQAGRRLVEDEYGWDAIVDRLEAVYRDVLAQA